jgi:hypothetical protein
LALLLDWSVGVFSYPLTDLYILCQIFGGESVNEGM